MMTKEETQTLGHAFFDGKVLQYRRDSDEFWVDWTEEFCPTFCSDFEWRIKPDEPKRIKLEAWLNGNNLLMYIADFGEGYACHPNWTRLEKLDIETELP